MEDKLLYENRFMPSAEDVHEYVAQNLPDKSPFSALVGCFIVAIGGFFWWQMMALGFIVNQFLHLFPALFILVAIMFTDVKLKQLALRLAIRKYLAKNKNALSESLSLFYADRFEVGGTSYGYAQVMKVLYGSSCMYLVLRGGGGVPVMIKDDDAAFVTGNREEFWPFLENMVKVEKNAKKSAVSLFRP